MKPAKVLLRLAAIVVVVLLAIFAFGLRHALAAGEPVEPGSDGPYLFRNSAGGWEHEELTIPKDTAPVVTSHPLPASGQIIVAAVGSIPSFEVVVRPDEPDEPDTGELPAGAQLFVLADTHGQYEIACGLLVHQHVISPDLRWSFGNGRLVILGDVFDRGPHQTEIFWLIYKLEAEAEAAGGQVYFLLGNHEAMELTGDHRYLDSRYAGVAHALHRSNFYQVWSEDSLLGRWLRSKTTVLKLDRALYLHAGVSPAMIEEQWTIAKTNQTMRAWLRGELPPADPGVRFLAGPLGPIWYRGYFSVVPKPAQATEAEVEALCHYFGVDRIVVGHTIVPKVTQLYSGRVVAVDVNMERAPDGGAIAEGILVENGRWFEADIDGTRRPLQPKSP